MDHHETVLILLRARPLRYVAGQRWPYEPSPEGYGAYLATLGVVKIDPTRELCVPPRNRMHQWIVAGRPSLVPPYGQWHWLGACCLLMDRIRCHLGQPLIYRYGYRPPAFNRAVGGAARSDHVSACAVDVDCVDDAHRRAVLHELALYWDEGSYGLSVGTSQRGKRIHLGVWAPETIRRKRQRQWTYPPGALVFPGNHA